MKACYCILLCALLATPYALAQAPPPAFGPPVPTTTPPPPTPTAPTPSAPPPVLPVLPPPSPSIVPTPAPAPTNSTPPPPPSKGPTPAPAPAPHNSTVPPPPKKSVPPPPKKSVPPPPKSAKSPPPPKPTPGTPGSTPSSGLTDADILQFALQLEYLEASFYCYAVTGQALPNNITGGGPTPSGLTAGSVANLTGDDLAVFTELCNDEMLHVVDLRAALTAAGVTPYAIPQIDIGPAFATAANAAFGSTLNPAFDPYANELFMYHGGFIFEDVGVGAYLGALPDITSKAYISVAAAIAATEAKHSSIIRTRIWDQQNVLTPYSVTPVNITAAIATLENTAAGVNFTTGIASYTSVTVAQLAAGNISTAISVSLTPQEVLAVAYLTGDSNKPGGFFPNGVSGYFGVASS